MQQDKLPTNKQTDLEKATSRRSRKDQEGRDFLCGCGKRYLSYPALYTHIKTKHQGRQPEGTQKTGTNVVAKRGKLKIQDDTLKTIYSYLDREDLKILGELEEIYFGTVPIHCRIKKQQVPKQIYECYTNLMKQQDCKITSTSTLELVLTIYLINVGQYVNDKLFDHFLLFAKVIRNCYAEHGDEVYNAVFSKKQGGIGYLSSFNVEECRYFPIICDFLVRFYIPISQSTKQYKDINLSLIELMLYDFCIWMYRKKLTFIKVELNKQYRLETKPAFISKPKISNHKNDNKQKQQNAEDSSQQAKKDIDQEYQELGSINQDQEDQEELPPPDQIQQPSARKSSSQGQKSSGAKPQQKQPQVQSASK